MIEGHRTITESSDLIRRGELTPSTLLEECLERIDRYESKVRAWVYLDRDGAREQAERLTTELKQGKNRGPLHGIPIGIKDIIDVFDMPTGCGSKLWANSYARRDATVVQRLRQAGAIIMGKTVTTAFASFDPSITRNPWNLERTPGGSSSGSAAAVACGMCLGALASQTGGSITRPASYCGVCSLKPSYGRVSVDGVLPLAPSMDHVGVMANCVRDLAILFEVIAGPDFRRGFTFGGNATTPDCQSAIARVNQTNDQPDLCILGGLFKELISSSAMSAYTKLTDSLSEALSFLDVVTPPVGFTDVLNMHRVIMGVEAAAYHSARLRRHPDDYPPKIRGLIEDGWRSTAIAYHSAQRLQFELADQCNKALNSHRFFVTPATIDVPPDMTTTGDPAFNSPWSFTGQPTISLPYSWSDDGLPFAVQLAGSAMCEDDLFTAAAWLETHIAFPRREVPL
jgi:Asp-tRNA(Asn)/Glu-tRNA(Gln) amidotransferase A subunit family amidase